MDARSVWPWGSVPPHTKEKLQSAGFRKAIHYHRAFNIKVLNCHKTEWLPFQGQPVMKCRLHLL